MGEATHQLPTLAATMAPIGPMIGVAVVYIALATWYWRRLGRGSVPNARRICRRWGLVFGGAALGAIVAGTAVVDSRTMPIPYLASWCIVGLSVFAVTVTAGVDVLLTMLFYRESLQRHMLRDAQHLRQAMEDREDRNVE